MAIVSPRCNGRPARVRPTPRSSALGGGVSHRRHTAKARNERITAARGAVLSAGPGIVTRGAPGLGGANQLAIGRASLNPAPDQGARARLRWTGTAAPCRHPVNDTAARGRGTSLTGVLRAATHLPVADRGGKGWRSPYMWSTRPRSKLARRTGTACRRIDEQGIVIPGAEQHSLDGR